MTARRDAQTVRRIRAELRNLREGPVEGCTVQPKSEDDLFEWDITIQGAPGTPYEDGTFHLSFSYPEDYPFHPPTVIFKTKIYHPNIESSTGIIGLSILHEEWSPVLTIETILKSIRAFLGTPDLNNVLVPEIAEEMQERYEEFEKTAREWVKEYAQRHRE